jgi:adenylate cyclase
VESIEGLFDWLVDGAPGAPSPPAVVGRLGPELVTAGVPLSRVEAFVRTLHPHIVGRSFVWEPGRPVEVLENSYADLQSSGFLSSPAAAVFRTGEAVRRRLLDPRAPRDFPALDRLAAEGVTDYLAAPLTFLSGQVHAITFATRAPAGFADEHVVAVLRLLRPLSRVAEIFALARTAANLLKGVAEPHEAFAPLGPASPR